MGVFVYFTAIGLEQILDVSSKVMQIVQVLASVGVGVAAYTIMVIAMKMEEAQQVLKIIKRKLRR